MSYSVEIRVDSYSGENIVDVLFIPHTFLVITDGNGNITTVGFAPEVTGLTGSGQIHDDTTHLYDASSGQIPLTEEQYNKLLIYVGESAANPPYYNLPFGSQCTVWALEGLVKADIIPSYIGPFPIEDSLASEILMRLAGFMQTLIFNPYTQKIGFEINEFFSFSSLTSEEKKRLEELGFIPYNSELVYDPNNLPYNPNNIIPNTPPDPLNPKDGHPFAPLPPLQRRDPLVLDMNKDGLISTVSLADSTAFFDLTGDGIKEKVGWVQASEGIVAFDKNGNGKIDGISEVFGTATTSGFAELRQLADSNYDGVIDRRDELYNQLKVWQDTNQDGISQASELKTLSQAGVTKIELDVFATNINLNGNLLSEAGRYSDATGTRSLAADVELTFDSRITTVDTSLIPDYTVHADAASLPKLRGYGVVYNSSIAYNVNDNLRNLAITMSADITQVANHFETFMSEWSGLNDLLRTTQDKYNLSTPPTLSAIDTKVWIYERFLGQKNFSVTIESSINSTALGMANNRNFKNTRSIA